MSPQVNFYQSLLDRLPREYEENKYVTKQQYESLLKELRDAIGRDEMITTKNIRNIFIYLINVLKISRKDIDQLFTNALKADLNLLQNLKDFEFTLKEGFIESIIGKIARIAAGEDKTHLGPIKAAYASLRRGNISLGAAVVNGYLNDLKLEETRSSSGSSPQETRSSSGSSPQETRSSSGSSPQSQKYENLQKALGIILDERFNIAQTKSKQVSEALQPKVLKVLEKLGKKKLEDIAHNPTNVTNISLLEKIGHYVNLLVRKLTFEMLGYEFSDVEAKKAIETSFNPRDFARTRFSDVVNIEIKEEELVKKESSSYGYEQSHVDRLYNTNFHYYSIHNGGPSTQSRPYPHQRHPDLTDYVMPRDKAIGHTFAPHTQRYVARVEDETTGYGFES
jgi:hypothetical protein